MEQFSFAEKMGRYRRAHKGNGLLFCAYSAVFFCIILIFSSLLMNAEKEMYSRSFYSENEIDFFVESKEAIPWNEILGSFEEKADLFCELPDEEIETKGIFVNACVKKPPMLEGEWFTRESSLSGKGYAVVGKDLKDHLIEKNGKTYYPYGEKNYEILGIMGTPKDSSLNKMVFLDFLSACEQNTGNTYIIDTKSEDASNHAMQIINGKMSSNISLQYALLGDEGKTGIYRIFEESKISLWMYLIILFTFLLNLIIITDIWIERRKTMFEAWFLEGYSYPQVLSETFKRYLGEVGKALLFVAALTALILAGNFGTNRFLGKIAEVLGQLFQKEAGNWYRISFAGVYVLTAAAGCVIAGLIIYRKYYFKRNRTGGIK